MSAIQTPSELVLLCRDYAVERHRSTNHYYDYHPYSFHLEMVVAAAEKFIHLIAPAHRASVIGACWAHDVIEDTRATYNDVKEALGEQVAEIVYALTNEKGRNRAERANALYYAGIRSNYWAIFVKCCDRIANMQYSMSKSQHGMIATYRKEYPHFRLMLIHPDFAEMFDYLETFMNE
jgi:(p)ppGpp synthase/HD superfamily hydrolase